MLVKLKHWAKTLKREIIALYIAYRHPDTPAIAKIIAFIIVAYAFSPIDLIPDFIPILGYLDDIILLPLGIMILMKLVPDEILAIVRREAEDYEKPTSFSWMRWVIYFMWLLAGIICLMLVFNLT